MTITLSLSVKRPEHLVGHDNNARLLDDLVTVLDGLACPLVIGLSARSYIGLTLEFYLHDDPLKEPVMEDDDAFDWAMEQIKLYGFWLHGSITNADVIGFEPDLDDGGEKEAKAQAALGVRPFSE